MGVKGVGLGTYGCTVELRSARFRLCGRERRLLAVTLLVDGAHVAKMSSCKKTMQVDNGCIDSEFHRQA